MYGDTFTGPDMFICQPSDRRQTSRPSNLKRQVWSLHFGLGESKQAGSPGQSEVQAYYRPKRQVSTRGGWVGVTHLAEHLLNDHPKPQHGQQGGLPKKG